jgi:hypothetical protein
LQSLEHRIGVPIALLAVLVAAVGPLNPPPVSAAQIDAVASSPITVAPNNGQVSSAAVAPISTPSAGGDASLVDRSMN